MLYRKNKYIINCDQPWQAGILPIKLTPTAVLWKTGPLLWLCLPVWAIKVLNPYFEAVACLAQKSRMESRRYFVREPAMINISYTKQQIDQLFQNSDSWAIVFAQFEGQINNLFPAHPLLPFKQLYFFIFSKVEVKDPLKDSVIIFTDVSSDGRAAVLVVKVMYCEPNHPQLR